MTERLFLQSFQTQADLNAVIATEMGLLRATPYPAVGGNNRPVENCISTLIDHGATTVVIQRRVHDPDFAAEYSAYYSRQFASVSRWCTRLHFFSAPAVSGGPVLPFLDGVATDTYLGFLTLRPVSRAPIGASILAGALATGFLRSSDEFPVNLAGVTFNVKGTPFMQQDNAVGACAQASIWMSLRTLRKREGDRAHDPAQITDAATKYFIHGRVRPNRQGLTIDQMTEAVRAAGYSPHRIPLGTIDSATGTTNLNVGQLQMSRLHLHAYVESEIPVLLVLFPPSGGHAVTIIGHTWTDAPTADQIITVTFTNGAGSQIAFRHAVSHVPEYIVHNDNTGPYRSLPQQSTLGSEYSLSSAAFAIPLLPADVFMTGEEALTFGMNLASQIFESLKVKAGANAIDAAIAGLTCRLQLAEKRKLRKWAANVTMANELREALRVIDLPRRVWVFELHASAHYGTHGTANAATLVGIVLIDPTGDVLDASLLLAHFNFPAIFGAPQGVLLKFDSPTPTAIQTGDTGPVLPLRT